MIKVVFYDLDGVLTNTCDLHYVALNKALKEKFGMEISPEEHTLTYNGLPTKVKLQMLIENGRLPPSASVDDINQLKQQYTLEAIRELSPDLVKRDVLINSRNLGCINICVTNTTYQVAQSILENTGLWPYINYLVSNSCVTNVKPSPDCYLKAKERAEIILNTQLNWNEILILEDSPIGIQAAENTHPDVNIITVNDINMLTPETITHALNYLNSL
jgi:beta-phosphoglucomutase